MNNKMNFKVGDWVILKYKSHKRPYKVLEVVGNELLLNTGEYPKRDNLWKVEDCSYWIPKVGDWVIPDTGIYEDIFVVMKYDGVALIPSRCRPFLGELPYES